VSLCRLLLPHLASDSRLHREARGAAYPDQVVAYPARLRSKVSGCIDRPPGPGYCHGNGRYKEAQAGLTARRAHNPRPRNTKGRAAGWPSSPFFFDNARQLLLLDYRYPVLSFVDTRILTNQIQYRR